VSSGLSSFLVSRFLSFLYPKFFSARKFIIIFEEPFLISSYSYVYEASCRLV
jgi:hypothetical protein